LHLTASVIKVYLVRVKAEKYTGTRCDMPVTFLVYDLAAVAGVRLMAQDLRDQCHLMGCHGLGRPFAY